MRRPTAAQLRARREFVKRFGHKRRHHHGRRLKTYAAYDETGKKTRVTIPPSENHRRHNPEGESRKRSIWPWVIGGGAVLLLMNRGGSLLGGILGPGGILGGGGGTPAGYVQVGTDASGHPIYQGPVGSAAPAGYVRTGTTATGAPVFTAAASAGGAAGMLATGAGILTGAASIATAIGRLFGGGTAGAATGLPIPPAFAAAGITPQWDSSGAVVGGYRPNADGTTTEFDAAGNITGTTTLPPPTDFSFPDLFPDLSLPDLSLPDFGTLFPDVTLPDFTLGPSLDLTLNTPDIFAGNVGGVADILGGAFPG